MSNKTVSLELVKPAKLSVVPKLKGGNDAATAKKLTKLFTDAQSGMRRIIAFGLFAWEIKETELKHGEFGAWLEAHCPKMVKADSVTGKPKASSQCSGYMDLTRNVLENVGLATIEKYLAVVAKFPNAGNLKHGGFLLIADKKVPAEAKPLREKIFELVDGKSQRQLFLEFKQTDDDGKVKKGRLKGQGGVTKAQRVNAEEAKRQERITEKTLKAEEIAEWLTEMSDDAGLGEISGTPQLSALDKAMETARGYIKHHGGAK